jgi:hypothetical protein
MVRIGAQVDAPAWRRLAAAVLLVVGSIVGVASLGAVFARTELLNTDRYVATVEPLADSTAIRHAVSGFVVTTIYQHVNVERVAGEALPPRGQFLAAPLSDGIRAFSGQVVERLLASGQFRTLWSAANRLAHDQLVALLENTSRRVGPVTLRDGAVTVDLSKTIAMAQQRLVRAGLTFVATVHVSPPRAQYRLIDSKLLAQVRGYVSLLNTLTWGLPVVTLAAFAAAIGLDMDRRRALLRVGVAFAAAMAVLAVLLAAARSLYLDSATGPQIPRDAAAAVFDTLSRYLRAGAYLGVAIGTIVAVAAWLAGPSEAAARTRVAVAAALGGVRRHTEALGWSPGPIAAYVARHRGELRVVGAGLLFALFVVWGQPTLSVVIGLAIALAVVMIAIQLAARAGAAPRASS